MIFNSRDELMKSKMGRRKRLGRHGNRFVPRTVGLEERTLLSTLKVTVAADHGTGSLRDAIASADDGDTIVFAKALAGSTIALTTGELEIDQSLNIQGLGSAKLSISGKGASRVFNITNPDAVVSLSGLTITNGAADQGAGVLDQGAALTISNCTFSSNTATGVSGTLTGGTGGDGLGGAIDDLGGNLTIAGTVFTLNQATGGNGSGSLGDGGAGDGGAIAVDAQLASELAISFTNVRFTGNQATGGQGGNSNFLPGVGGSSSGGAIYIDADLSSDFTVNVTGGTFSGNDVFGGSGGSGAEGGLGAGGAIAFEGSSAADPTFSLMTDTFSNQNSATGGAGGNDPGGEFPTQGGDGGDGQGGALWVDAASSSTLLFSVTSDTFTGSVATGGVGGTPSGDDFAGVARNGVGGALYYTAGMSVVPTLTAVHSVFSKNTATGAVGPAGGSANTGGTGGFGGTGEGGGIVTDLADAIGPTVTLTGDTITANTSIGGVGGVGGPGNVIPGFGGAGGAGGEGGDADSGGLRLIAEFAADIQVTVSHTTINSNVVKGGAGGQGGIGSTGGPGGEGGFAFGGGIFVESPNNDPGDPPDGTDAFTLDTDVIESNRVQAGAGGNGGTGTVGFGGIGGPSHFGIDQSSGFPLIVYEGSAGAGIVDLFHGIFTILHGVIAQNAAVGAPGGAGGSGLVGSGLSGTASTSHAGGILVGETPAFKSHDTVISGNTADSFADVDGTITNL